MPNKLAQVFEQIAVIARLPVVRLQFRLELNPQDVAKMHQYFTKPHPKYKIFRNKSMGAALVNLSQFHNREEYLDSLKGTYSALRHARKAKNKGYIVTEIDRNDYIDDIYEINTSTKTRQGLPMDADYLVKKYHYPNDPNFKYFGALNPSGKLMAYGDLGLYGNFAAFNRIIGVRNNDGIMHLLVAEIVCRMIESGNYQYLMYDTYFGASPGLKTFKEMLGFQPYRAKYSIT